MKIGKTWFLFLSFCPASVTGPKCTYTYRTEKTCTAAVVVALNRNSHGIYLLLGDSSRAKARIQIYIIYPYAAERRFARAAARWIKLKYDVKSGR